MILMFVIQAELIQIEKCLVCLLNHRQFELCSRNSSPSSTRVPSESLRVNVVL